LWQFVDGAYFENSGIETAHQMILGLQAAIERGAKEQREAHEIIVPVRGKAPDEASSRKVKVAFRLISIRTIDAMDASGVHGELTTPMVALMNARFKRASLARYYARASLCPQCKLAEISLSDSFRESILDFSERTLPMGWILSTESRNYVKRSLGDNRDCRIGPGSAAYAVADVKSINACLYQSIVYDLM
jgi:hypothetical protein